MKAIFFFIGVFFSCLKLSAQTEKQDYGPFDWIQVDPTESFENFTWEKLPKGVTQDMVEQLLTSPYLTTEDPLTLFLIQGELIAVIPCRFEVLQWNGKAWDNLYKGTASGFNCHAHFFVREGKLYSMGRYGFWEGHSELLEFDFRSGGWEFVSVTSPPAQYGGVGIFVDGDRLFSLMGQYIHQPSNLFAPEKNGFVFDFKSRAWNPVHLDFPKQTTTTQWIYPSFDLKDFGIQLYHLEAHIGLLLFHKKESSLYFAKDNNFGKFNFFAVAVALENNAIFYSKNGEATSLLPETGLWEKFTKVGQVSLKKTTETPASSAWLSYVLMGGGLFFGLGVLLFVRRKMARSSIAEKGSATTSYVEQGTIDGEEDMAKLVAKLLTQPVFLVDVHQLDQLFGSSTRESLDYRRVKRSRYIKAINQYYQVQNGRDLIFRTKSEVDKRITLYRISP